MKWKTVLFSIMFLGLVAFCDREPSSKGTFLRLAVEEDLSSIFTSLETGSEEFYPDSKGALELIKQSKLSSTTISKEELYYSIERVKKGSSQLLLAAEVGRSGFAVLGDGNIILLENPPASVVSLERLEND